MLQFESAKMQVICDSGARLLYKMEIHAWIFLLSGFIALLIAVLTISYQSLKSASMNPVSSLRSE